MITKKISKKKKNPIAHELGQQKYRQRIVKNKSSKETFSEKKTSLQITECVLTKTTQEEGV